MGRPRHSSTFALSTFAFLVALAAQADPAEDYAQGRQAFFNDDLIGAMERLRRAASSGHTPAQTLLAYILDRAEEDEEALALYRDAARKGDAGGMFGLATMYASGEGVDKNPEAALHWLRAAGDRGHDQALLALAEAYLKGDLGLSADRDQAIALLGRSAANGYEPARARLAALTPEKP